nr:L-tyrosine/L-tryptophan isonitrile synthase family protein [Pseudoalteromonas sp. S16_S37]
MIFDLDGTLVDTLKDIAYAMDRTLAHFGLERLGEPVYRQYIGGGSRDMVEHLCPEHLSVDTVYKHYLEEYQTRLCQHTSPYQGVHQALRDFKALGLKVLVVTNKHQSHAQVVLKTLFDDIEFDAIVGANSQFAKKPDPTSTLTVLDRLNLHPSQTLFIGDTSIDINTALAAGVTPVWVAWGYGNISELPNPLILQISEITQLGNLVNEKLKGMNMSQFDIAIKKQPQTQIQQEQSLHDTLLNIIERYLVRVEGDKFATTGRALLATQLAYFVEESLPIEMILPGFPCKSPNQKDKSFSVMPDYGEVIAIERLDEICAQIKQVYKPGCKLTILSDGTTFNDIVQVTDEQKEHYKNALRQLTITEHIQWADLQSLVNTQDDAECSNTLREQLVAQLGLGKNAFNKFAKEVQSNQALSSTHDKLCSYLYHDINLEPMAEADRDQYLQSICDKAYTMMFRGKALSYGIEKAFPNHIRLSVHQYDNAGPKFTFALTKHQQQSTSPWHTVPVRKLSGEYVQLPHAIALESLVVPVYYQGHKWLYLEVANNNAEQFDFELIKTPKIGLKITKKSGTCYEQLSSEFLQSLSQEFGFVVLKQVNLFEPQDLVKFCEPYGQLYHWNFGPVKVVKPEENPTGYVMSTEKTPLHWDLSMLPANTPEVIENPRFTAHTFMLYCKTPPAKGEGQTLLVDSRCALKIAGQDKVEQWRALDVTYNTKMTYYGGSPHTYPLVYTHPVTGDDIFRYQEGSQLAMQTFTLSNSDMPQAEFNAAIRDAHDVAYDPRCLVEYEWQAGDLVIIDNYYTLHGRAAMSEASMQRELWRVQVY